MSIDWAEIALISGIVVAGTAGISAIFLLLWWLIRQYYLLLEKRYGVAASGLIVTASSIGGVGAFAPTIPLLYGSTLATPVMIALIAVVIAVPVARTWTVVHRSWDRDLCHHHGLVIRSRRAPAA